MGEAYGGGLLGRLEQFYDAIPGGMRGQQAPLVRAGVTAALAYGVQLASAPVNKLQFHENGEMKSMDEMNPLLHPYVVSALLGAMAGTFV
jgi:hypothetical protein